MMSEYADILVGRLSLYSFRNYVSPEIVRSLFCKSDLQTIPDYVEDPDDADSVIITKYIYKTTVRKAKERLDAQGYTLSRFEVLFNENQYQAIDYSSFLSHLHVDFEDYDEKAKERNKKNITFTKWKNSMNKIISYELCNGNIVRSKVKPEDVKITTECDKVIFYSLQDDDSETYYAIFSEQINHKYVFRMILECCDENEMIELDFTNLQYWDEDCVAKAVAATDDTEKTIVLVEGTSDKDILEFSVKNIYPHLSDLFYFMDFDDENGKRDGGTSYVIKNLKTFYFSKIKKNFIAIFDNDAEGYASKCTLLSEIKSWPNNFKILLYPNVEILKSYPTIVPNGSIMNDDINKKAASIELYLPDSIIKNELGYFPIEWEARKKIKNNGFDEALYQGVISQKDDIKHNFHTLRNQIEKDATYFKPEEWERMRVLVESIVFAFR